MPYRKPESFPDLYSQIILGVEKTKREFRMPVASKSEGINRSSIFNQFKARCRESLVPKWERFAIASKNMTTALEVDSTGKCWFIVRYAVADIDHWLRESFGEEVARELDMKISEEELRRTDAAIEAEIEDEIARADTPSRSEAFLERLLKGDKENDS